MKKIEAIVKPFEVDLAREALYGIGVSGVTATEVHGLGGETFWAGMARGASFVADFLPKIRLEMIVPDDAVERVTRVVLESCHDGHSGDGKIFVIPIDDANRVHAGERRQAAVSRT